MIFFSPKEKMENGKGKREGKRRDFLSFSFGSHRKTFFWGKISYFPLNSNVMFSPFKKLICCTFMRKNKNKKNVRGTWFLTLYIIK